MIDPKILNEIKEYCRLNDINTNTLINKVIRRGFSIEKYGETPNKTNKEPEKIIEYVEVDKPVEVEKIVKVSDDKKIDELLQDIENNKQECDDKINEIKDNYKEKLDELIHENVDLKIRLKNRPTDLYGE